MYFGLFGYLKIIFVVVLEREKRDLNAKNLSICHLRGEQSSVAPKVVAYQPIVSPLFQVGFLVYNHFCLNVEPVFGVSDTEGG